MIIQNQISLLDSSHIQVLIPESSAFPHVVQDARFHNVESLIVKITHRCNLDCAYCYEHITKGSDMPLEVLRSRPASAQATITPASRVHHPCATAHPSLFSARHQHHGTKLRTFIYPLK